MSLRNIGVKIDVVFRRFNERRIRYVVVRLGTEDKAEENVEHTFGSLVVTIKNRH